MLGASSPIDIDMWRSLGGISVSTILVVDDEQHIVQLVKLYLTKEGYQVDSAGDGHEALRKVRQTKPDLVVLDLMLPGIDGL